MAVVFFEWVMLGKGLGAYNKAPTKEIVEK